MGQKKTDPSIRFWKKVHKTESCWLWTAGCFTNGYGQFFNGIRKICAHRFAYEEKNGSTNGLILCHKCDNPKCVNPDHLFVGTHQDNHDDKWSKGRGRTGRNNGEVNGRSELTWSDVYKIRELHRTGASIAMLARKYQRGESTIRHIVQGTTWKKENL